MSIRLFNPSGGFIDLNAGGDGTAANVFTLPAETGTLLTSASNANFPAGSVLQVVQVDFDSETSTSSSTYADISQSASITPSSASNKILILYAGNVQCDFSGSVGEAFVGIFKDSDATPLASTRFEWNALNRATFTCAINYLHSPSTTSSVTYSIKGRRTTGVLKFNDGGEDQGSSITLMEIAA
jgi:hypothetical protein